MNLSTSYLGIELKNPIIAGASNLSADIENLKKMEAAGAAAIVYKSLFEEQIQLENLEESEITAEYNERNAEMLKLFPLRDDAGPKAFLYQLKKAKEAVGIPLIASLNAVYKDTWVEYAKQIEQTGVDALELNFYAVPLELEKTGQEVEQQQLEIVKKIKAVVSIPVSVKLSPFYANPLNIISQMDKKGANGFVLFNTLFQPDFDIDKEEQYYPYDSSSNKDNRLPMRFAGLLYDNISGSICSSTGIATGKDVSKMILAGADAVQVVGTLYKNGIDYIGTMLTDIESWMESKGYQSLSDFKGKMAKKNLKDFYAYRRAQYVDILLKSSEYFKKYPMR